MEALGRREVAVAGAASPSWAITRVPCISQATAIAISGINLLPLMSLFLLFLSLVLSFTDLLLLLVLIVVAFWGNSLLEPRLPRVQLATNPT